MFEEKYQDEVIVCKDCGEEFTFTARDKEFYAEKGYQNKPQRCRNCRNKRKQSEGAPKEYHVGVCAGCGKEAKVPFKPVNDKPIYCSECFARLKNTAEE